MPRQLRLEYPGAIYHVMNRGDRREPIFHDDSDRKRFVTTLGEACTKTAVEKARRIMQEELDKLGWTAKDLATRAKGDVRKVRLARWLRTQTSVAWKWIAEELHLGSWTHAASRVQN